MDFNFEQWQRDQEAKKNSLQSRIRTALDNGKFVGEQIRKEYTSLWPACSPFYPEVSTPAYLAEHLINRHFGFGFELIVDGIRYYAGKEK